MLLNALVTLSLALPHATPQGHQQRPSVHATLLRVQAEIRDGVATTNLIQTIRNEGRRDAEAIWILPLPVGSSADHFTMTVNGKEISGEILEPHKARSIYEDIVRRRRDPGLLEYLGHGCLRARLFPIPAHGEIKVRVRYRQILESRNGLFEWNFPLRAAGLQGRSAERIVVDLSIKSRTPIKNLYSPSGSIDLLRKGDHEARASLEIKAGHVPEEDLSIFYGVSADRLGLDLLTWRKAEQPGYFLMMLSPQHEWPKPASSGKVIQFVIDTSGSMQGKKIAQAKAALRFFANSLNANDRFNVVPFATEARPFFASPVPADETHLASAMGKIDALVARGGTNIEAALGVALAANQTEASSELTTTPIIVFLTDGQPTVGSTDIDQLVSLVERRNHNGARVFVFGVGDEVNTHLLDKIAAKSRGDRDYVREHENIEVKTSALFTKLSNPVLTDVSLHVEGLEVIDMLPRALPDLFKGGRLLVVGRYLGHGPRAIHLKAMVDGTQKEFVFEGSFTKQDQRHDFVPSLWAQRRIGQLLSAIRMNGNLPELVDEIQRLGREHGLVTPYTSHLIVEESMRVARARGQVRTGATRPDHWQLFGDAPRDLERVSRELQRAGSLRRDQATSLPQSALIAGRDADQADLRLRGLAKKSTGKIAIDDSLEVRQLERSAARQSQAGSKGAGLVSQRIHDRSFHLVGGVWVDANYTLAMQGKELKMQAFSKEYFALLRKHPEIGRYLAFSSRMVLVLAGQAVEIE